MSNVPQFAWSSRVLHWLMAVALLAMLAIGMTMVVSLEHYRRLVAIHRPLGVLILLLAVIRLVNRRLKPLPPFLATMSARERVIATASERLLYGLMLLLPLVGWGMLSAAQIPVRVGPMVLPPILPHSLSLYTLLRRAHTVLAYLLFISFMAHLSAVLFHTVVLRDGLLSRMLPWRPRDVDGAPPHQR
ncbi:MAG TPA: cytochrome b/b6 domain-containing protein [Polyangiaceae bacterium]|nr:cytochrome b/b6 domain-containing protein [Polyangiaceae bacterium]